MAATMIVSLRPAETIFITSAFVMAASFLEAVDGFAGGEV
jgi:hypothetical protein